MTGYVIENSSAIEMMLQSTLRSDISVYILCRISIRILSMNTFSLSL